MKRFAVKTGDKEYPYRVWDMKYNGWVIGTGSQEQDRVTTHARNLNNNKASGNALSPDSLDFELMDYHTRKYFYPNRYGRNE